MLKKISLMLFVAILTVSCELNGDAASSCPQVIGVSTLSVTGPIETTIDVPITLEVSYLGKKNCGSFSRFFNLATTDVFVDIVTVNVIYDSCSCDEIVSTVKENYTFKKDKIGVYKLKFRETNEIFVEHTVTVK